MIARRAQIDLALPRDPSAAADARRELHRRLDHTLHQDVLDALSLVVSELVTNAVMHGQGAIRFRLQLASGDLRGDVIDDGDGFEHELRAAGPHATAGRGLLIVDRLTTRWGVHEGTTHVWFEMLTGSPVHRRKGPHVGEERRPRQLPD